MEIKDMFNSWSRVALFFLWLQTCTWHVVGHWWREDKLDQCKSCSSSVWIFPGND